MPIKCYALQNSIQMLLIHSVMVVMKQWKDLTEYFKTMFRKYVMKFSIQCDYVISVQCFLSIIQYTTKLNW